jgi:hypothetical protein
MIRPSEIKKCRCGYSIITYTVQSEIDSSVLYQFFDGHSGDYRQCFICPGCKDRLSYMTLEG